MVDENGTLIEYLDALEVPDGVGRDWLLDEFLAPLGIAPESELADVVEEVVLALLSGDHGAFNLRPGGWRLYVAGTTVKAALAGALLSASLFLQGSTDIPAELLVAVVPLLIDVERVQLNRRDRELLVPLRIAATSLDGLAVDPRALFDRLEPSVRAEVTYGDFLDFCDRLVESGLMDDAGSGMVRTRPDGAETWLRVTWR